MPKKHHKHSSKSNSSIDHVEIADNSDSDDENNFENGENDSSQTAFGQDIFNWFDDIDDNNDKLVWKACEEQFRTIYKPPYDAELQENDFGWFVLSAPEFWNEFSSKHYTEWPFDCFPWFNKYKENQTINSKEKKK